MDLLFFQIRNTFFLKGRLAVLQNIRSSRVIEDLTILKIDMYSFAHTTKLGITLTEELYTDSQIFSGLVNHWCGS